MAFDRNVELLVDLQDIVVDKLMKKGKIKHEAAVEISRLIALEIINHWRGQQIYIPQSLPGLLSERDHALFKEFNGKNLKEMIEKYGLSQGRVYAICKQVREENLKQSQGDLFSNGDS